MILKEMNFSLNNKMEATDKYLALANQDMAYLKSMVPDGEEVYLTLAWDNGKEHVLAQNIAGIIVLTRGVDSTAKPFPKGSCVYFENSIPVTKWLICNHQCCDGDCPVEAVRSAGFVAPEGKAGNAWEGSAVFSGDLPMSFGVTNMPNWMQATYTGNHVKLSGTAVAGTYTISVAASNNRGQNIAVQQVVVKVK